MSQRSSLDGTHGGTDKPLPRRAFDLHTPVSIPSTPNPELQSSKQSPAHSPTRQTLDGTSTPPRTRSILNLTSSTLFGIYRDTDYTTDKDESSTPWGTGAETPADGNKRSIDALRNSIPDAFSREGGAGSKNTAVKRKDLQVTRRRSHYVRKGFRGYWLPLIGNTLALFITGVLYGLLISHLHDQNDIPPVKVEGINHSAWQYLISWGLAGILMGRALPYVDEQWRGLNDGSYGSQKPKGTQTRGSGAWNDVVRSIGMFVGIAFAVRKIAWQSTIQLSLTLALVNPCLWYLIDRTAPGLIVSTLTSIFGTALLLGINPDLVPPPSTTHQLPSHIDKRMGEKTIAPTAAVGELPIFGLFSEESFGVATWIVSVLFVSCVCFGNIGRRLAVERT